MDRLWREMDLPAIVGGGASTAPRNQQAASASAAAEREPRTTQQMVDRYYQHIATRLGLQRLTDERIMAVLTLAQGADNVQSAVTG